MLASTHLSTLINACFEVNRSAHYIFAFPNIYVYMKVAETSIQQIKKKKNGQKLQVSISKVPFCFTFNGVSVAGLSIPVASSLFHSLTQHCTMKETLIHIPALSLNRSKTVHTYFKYKANF